MERECEIGNMHLFPGSRITTRPSTGTARDLIRFPVPDRRNASEETIHRSLLKPLEDFRHLLLQAIHILLQRCHLSFERSDALACRGGASDGLL